jgi:exonuclease SbcC
VCAQTVAILPRGARAAKAETAAKALDRTRGTRDKRRKRADTAREGVATRQARSASAGEALVAARRDAKAATDALDKAARALDKADALLADLLGPGDPVEELSSRRKKVAAAHGTLQDAEQGARVAAAVRSDARGRAERVRDEVADVAGRLSGVWGRLGENRNIGRTPDELRAAFADVGTRLLSAHEEAALERDEATAKEREATAALEALRAEVGIAPGERFSAAITAAATAHGTAGARVQELQRVLGGQRALASRVKKAERRRDLAERLSEDLRPSAFLRFLLEEERAELGALGSEHFQDLTDGSYRFSDDGEFAVLDMNAGGTQRRADSLSGGETFLASLALALALAEMVARGGGRMDAFFLDEGFGSLDPDHLDKAMEGIERLVAESEHRLVVVVSHVSAMREAIEDLVVLDKDPTTGDTLVRSGARNGA